MSELEVQEISELVEAALDLEEGDERISLLEVAVRLADREGDLELQYSIREEWSAPAYSAARRKRPW